MNCKYHPDREAVVGCTGCGELVCQDCDVVVGRRHFCRKCLADAADSRPHGAAGLPGASPSVKKLYRSSRDRMLSGVCGGFAEYAAMDPTLVRILTVLLVFFSGIVPGVIGYIIAACVMPKNGGG